MAVTLPPIQNPSPETRRRIAVGLGELGFSAALLLGYFILRGLRPDDIEPSVSRSLHVIRLEHQLGLFIEPTIQSAAHNYDWLISFANFVYAWGMFPLIGVVAAWLAFGNVSQFRFFRNVMLVSGTFGLVCYWLFPAAPPRLMEIHGYDFGFVDTVFNDESGVNYFQPGPLVNDYAALPSFHFGWVALVSACIWIGTQVRVIRIAAVIFPVIMWFSIIITANHFLFDMVFGAAVVGLSWLFVTWLQGSPPRERLGRLRQSLRGSPARASN